MVDILGLTLLTRINSLMIGAQSIDGEEIFFQRCGEIVVSVQEELPWCFSDISDHSGAAIVRTRCVTRNSKTKRLPVVHLHESVREESQCRSVGGQFAESLSQNVLGELSVLILLSRRSKSPVDGFRMHLNGIRGNKSI